MRKTIQLFIVTIFISLGLISQSVGQSTDTTQIISLLEESESFLETDLLKAKEKALKGLEFSKQIGFIRGSAQSNFILGEIASENSEINAAFSYFEKSASQFLSINLIDKSIIAQQRIGEEGYYASRYDKAILAFKEVLKYRRSVADTSEIVNNLIRISICYEEQGEYDASIQHATEGYELSLSINNLADASRCLNSIAFIHRARGESDLALEYFNKGYDLAVEADKPSYQATFIQNMGIVYSRSGEYVKSLEAYLKALKIFEELNDSLGISELQFNIGLIYKNNGEYLKAIQYYNESFLYDLKNADTLGIIYCHHNIGNAFLELDEYDSAKYHLYRAFNLIKNAEINCFDGEAGALGNLYYELDVLDSAEYFLNLEYNSGLRCDNLMNLSKTTYLLGLINQDLKKDSRALKFFMESYAAAQSTGYLKDLENTSQALYQWYKSRGNSSKSLQYLEVFQQTNDSLFNQTNTRKLTWMEANFQMERKTDSLNIIKKDEARILNGKIDQQNEQLLLLFIISGAIILLLLAYYVYQRNRKQLDHQLAIAAEKQMGFKAVINATEEERKRIAKELHDGIVQQLGGLKLGLQKEFANSETDETKKLVKILDDSAQELRELSHRMMPKALSELGLVPALEDMLASSLGNTNIKFEFEHFGITTRLKETIEITIYRIAQELINNVTKHSKASHVNVQLFKSGKYLVLIVEDNGKGFELESKKQGIGLLNISSRLDTVNGKVNFEPSPQSGTLATVKIPVA